MDAFLDHEQLHDGTNASRGRYGISHLLRRRRAMPDWYVTEGVLNLFVDLCDDAPREADHSPWIR